MTDVQEPVFTAFLGFKRLASGPLSEVALAAKRAIDRGAQQTILIYNDHSGRAMDIDTRGNDGEIVSRLARPAPAAKTRGPGRPKLGVIAREVTLLPRHWQWLGAQPGGASVAIRKLVEAARRSSQGSDNRREKQEAAYHFILSIAGNLLNFEEATRALFANQQDAFVALMSTWPADVREHALQLAFSPA
jgi:hypothetical protein